MGLPMCPGQGYAAEVSGVGAENAVVEDNNGMAKLGLAVVGAIL